MGHDHKHSKYSRRDFLNLFGYSTTIPLLQSPAQILIESIIASAAQKVWAADTSVNPRRFIQIVQEGAPTKWMFDLFLSPYSTNYVANTQLGMKFNGQNVVYSTVARKNINVPHLWQFTVPKNSGGYRNMDELLDNMLVLRGMNVNNVDHSACQAMQNLPLAASQSMSSLSSDLSSAPIHAVNVSLGEYRFKSKKSKSAITVSNSGNMVKNLLSPFIRKTGATHTLEKTDMKVALNSALQALNNMSDAIHPDAKSISTVTNSAKDLLAQGFGDLDTVWTSLTTKYNNLIKAAINPSRTFSGLNDNAILSDGTKLFSIDNEFIASGTDLRTLITTNTNISRMANHFAMVEYVITKNLSSSISIAPGGFYNLSYNSKTAGMGFDEHNTSGRVATYVNSFYNMAMATCLLELIDQLKLANMFNDSVIVMGGEFSRNPRNDGGGSDHGNTGTHSTIISGAITSPLVLGNVYLTDPNTSSSYSGTWGQGAKVTELGKELDLGHWASTVATLLRAPTPVTASPSLIIEQNGQYVPIIEKAKQV